MEDDQTSTQNEPVSVSVEKVWKKPGKSVVWNYFEKIEGGTNVLCRLCGKIYPISKSKSTSALLNHLRHQHKMKFSLQEPREHSIEPRSGTPPTTSFQSLEESLHFLPNEQKFLTGEDQFAGIDIWNRDDSSSSRDQSVAPIQKETKEDGRVQVLADLVRQQSLQLLQNGNEAKFQNFWRQVICAVAESNV